MSRREFITLLGSAAVAWPLDARAQQRERMRRIGVLMHLAADDPEGQSRLAAFLQGLQEAGWAVGRNVTIDVRWAAADVDSMKRFAKELVTLQPDLIITSSTPATAAMLQATRTIPVIFVLVADPVGSGFVASLPRPGSNVDINALVDESLNLAYHGARAEKQGFNVTLEKSFDPAAGEVDLFPQEITRVLLNLISNGFYAATKRKAETNEGDYEPTLAAATKSLGDKVEIRIRDNGTGIPPDVREKLFNPFFTTKPAGEGTGLGLSISHDIIVKQHGGSIEVDTQPGDFTEFRIVLPRAAAFAAKSGGRV